MQNRETSEAVLASRSWAYSGDLENLKQIWVRDQWEEHLHLDFDFTLFLLDLPGPFFLPLSYRLH